MIGCGDCASGNFRLLELALPARGERAKNREQRTRAVCRIVLELSEPPNASGARSSAGNRCSRHRHPTRARILRQHDAPRSANPGVCAWSVEVEGEAEVRGSKGRANEHKQ